jgi:hypothetical protein
LDNILFLNRINIQKDRFLEGINIDYLVKYQYDLVILGGISSKVKNINRKEEE